MTKPTPTPPADETPADETPAQTGGATPWSLGGEPPAPQRVKRSKAPTADSSSKIDTAATHTGTDPLGRAIGPAENHKNIKKVRDASGKVVTPNRDGSLPGSKAKR